MQKQGLTFDAVDDLVGAHARGKLNPTARTRSFAPIAIGPLVELAFTATNGRYGPLLKSAWLDPLAQHDLRSPCRDPRTSGSTDCVCEVSNGRCLIRLARLMLLFVPTS